MICASRRLRIGLNGHYDFAEVGATFQVGEGGWGLGEGEDAVDDRLEAARGEDCEGDPSLWSLAYPPSVED
jgi:hypothetical protein